MTSKLTINNKHLLYTLTGDNQPTNLIGAISTYIAQEYDRFKTQRSSAEDDWLEAWSLYLGTPEAVDHQRQQVLHTVGLVNTDWRHKINTGKAFEVVETIHGYLMSALFPNNEWFNVVPNESGLLDLARLVKKYTANKLMDAKFRAHFENFLRQLLITGNSVMALPWRYETRKWKKNVKVTVPEMGLLGELGETVKWVAKEELRCIRNSPEFETLDMFDCFVDPTATDPNDATFIRRLIKTRAEVVQNVTTGYYKGISAYDVCNHHAHQVSEDHKNLLRSFQGVETDEPYSMSETLEVIEFWGDIHLDGVTYHDVCATLLGSHLVRFEANPFWGGKPFVVGTCIQLTQTPYSIGVIAPNMGLLHQLNIITNQRLDNLELAIDEMYTLKQDGVLQPEDVSTEPGKVFLVAEHDDIRPVARNTQHYTVTYQEGSVLEQTIDRNVGTGALVSANSARSGERVTAAEIQAVRDAGGNRLSNLHKHIEDTSLLLVLSKVYRSMQQFVTEDEAVRVAGVEPGEYDYFTVGADELQYDLNFRPVGADHVTDKSRYIKDRLEFLSSVASVPQMAELLNYEKILYDLVQHFGFDEPDSYLVKPKQSPMGEAMRPESAGIPSEAMPPATEPTLMDKMYDIGGTAQQAALQNELGKDGGASLAADLFGADISGMAPPPMDELPIQ